MVEFKFKDTYTNRYENIAYYCKRWRIANNIPITDVAIDTDYTKENIIKFEQGKNNNMTILLWYILNGMDVSFIARNGVKSFEVATNS